MIIRSFTRKFSFEWLKRLDPLKFIKGESSEPALLDADSPTIDFCRMSVKSAITNYDNLVSSVTNSISEIEKEIYESLSNVKPFETRFGSYTFTAKLLQNGHTQFFRQKRSFKQLMFDTSNIANVYSKHNYCILKNMNFSPKLDLLCVLCDVHGNDRNTLFVKSLNKHQIRMESVTNVENSEFLDTLNKCHIFYTRYINKCMQLRYIRYYRNKLVNDALIYSETDPNRTLGIYKTRDSKILFITTNTSYMSKLLYIIKLNRKGNPKILKLSLNDTFDKLFLEHRHNHIIALTRYNSQYKLIALSTNRKYNKIYTNWPLDNNINILGFEAFNKGIILHGIKNPSIPIIGLLNNYHKIPELNPLIDSGVITPESNPDFNADVFHFTLENPAISYVPSFMSLSDSKIQSSDYAIDYKFKSYTFTSFDQAQLHISVIYTNESDKGIIYFYGFSNQLLKLHSEYEHKYLLKRGYKLCFIHSRSHDPNITLKDIIYGINYLLDNGIINQTKLSLVTESAGSSIVDELLKAFMDLEITFILKSPHLPLNSSQSKNNFKKNNKCKRIFLMNVGALDEKTPWWESFAYIIGKSMNDQCNITTFLDFKEDGGHNTGSTFIKKISLAANIAAILVNF